MNGEEQHVADSRDRHSGAIENDEISLSDLWQVLAKRKKVFIAIFLISLLGGVIYCFAASPIYRLETHAKIYIPKDMITIKELPTAKDIASMIGKIDREKKAIIFSKTADEINEARIEEVRGTTDRFKISIESRDRESLPVSLQELLDYAENIREIRNDYEKIISEMDERIKNVTEAINKNDFQVREIEKRLVSSKLLPVGFNPIEINNKTAEIKMEKHRLEQERSKYKVIKLMQDPFIPKDPVKPKKALILTITCLGGLMIGVFFSFMAEYVERSKEKMQYR